MPRISTVSLKYGITMIANRIDTNFTLYPPDNKLFKYQQGQEMAANLNNNEDLSGVASGNHDMDAQSFDVLLQKISEDKDRDAFIELFNHFAPRIKSFLMKSGLNPDVADELAQETMLTVWNKADQYKSSQAAASTWIFTIARNKKIDYFRKHSKTPLTKHDLAFSQSEQALPDDEFDQEQQQDKIAQLLSEIPEEQALLIQKAYFEDKTHQDIAQETGIALGTVKSRIRLGLERLRHLLDGIDL